MAFSKFRQSNFFCSSFELGLDSRMATIDLNIGLHQIRIVSTFVLTGRKAKYTRSKLRNFFSEKGAFSDFNGRPFNLESESWGEGELNNYISNGAG